MKRIVSGALTLLLLLSLCACSLPVSLPDGNSVHEPAAADGGAMQVTFLDVGQGDCELIVLPDGKTILIDAGESKSADDIISFLEEQGISRLDYVIATHPHADHIGGMQEVIEAFDVGEIYMPKVEHDTKTYENLLLAIQEKSLRVPYCQRRGNPHRRRRRKRAVCCAVRGQLQGLKQLFRRAASHVRGRIVFVHGRRGAGVGGADYG